QVHPHRRPRGPSRGTPGRSIVSVERLPLFTCRLQIPNLGSLCGDLDITMKTIALFVGIACELAACRSTPVPPPAADVAAPPADAQVLAGGVAYKVIAAGHGAETVGPDDFIRYNVTAWRA